MAHYYRQPPVEVMLPDERESAKARRQQRRRQDIIHKRDSRERILRRRGE